MQGLQVYATTPGLWGLEESNSGYAREAFYKLTNWLAPLDEIIFCVWWIDCPSGWTELCCDNKHLRSLKERPIRVSWGICSHPQDRRQTCTAKPPLSSEGFHAAPMWSFYAHIFSNRTQHMPKTQRVGCPKCPWENPATVNGCLSLLGWCAQPNTYTYFSHGSASLTLPTLR